MCYSYLSFVLKQSEREQALNQGKGVRSEGERSLNGPIPGDRIPIAKVHFIPSPAENT
jgi:hypothetical protein